MKAQKTKPPAAKPTNIKNLEPRHERDVKAGLSLNFTKVEYGLIDGTVRWIRTLIARAPELEMKPGSISMRVTRRPSVKALRPRDERIKGGRVTYIKLALKQSFPSE